ARSRARAVFKKRVHDHSPAQRGDFLDRSCGYFLERVGRVQHEANFIGRQVFQAEQVLACPADGGRVSSHLLGSTEISSRPSVSVNRTLTRWSRGTCGSDSPTKSA